MCQKLEWRSNTLVVMPLPLFFYNNDLVLTLHGFQNGNDNSRIGKDTFEK